MQSDISWRFGRRAFAIFLSPKMRAIEVLMVFKFAYLLFVSCLILSGIDEMHPASTSLQRITWRKDGRATFESYFTTWDAAHYLHLSEDGYDEGDVSCAFYPLWPFLIRWSSVLAGGNHVIAGMVLSNIFSLIGALILLDIVSARFGASAGWWTVMLIFAFPGSLFFQFIYTESLFFLLVLLVVRGLQGKQFRLAVVAALLLPLTRAVGILCILPIAFPMAFQVFTRAFDNFRNRLAHFGWAKWIPSARAKSRDCDATTNGTEAMLAAAVLSGWAVYLSLMWFWTGNPFEGFTAQKHWGVQSLSNLFALPHFISALFTPTTWHGWTGSVLDRAAFIMIFWSLPFLWRLNKQWFVWTVVLGVVPAVSGTFTSFIRFASVVFPTFIAMGIWLGKSERRILRALVLTSFATVHVILLYRFIFFQWAG